MYNLSGEYDCKIDAKGRLKMPTALLKQLGVQQARFTINRGFEKHLMIYPQDVWEKKTKEINHLNIYVKKNREAIRYFHRGATQLSCDASDRILVPKRLKEYADLEKEIVLFAYNDQIELWAKDKYDEMLESEPDDFSALAEDVFGEKIEADE